ncbi:MAG: hypothetical protein ON057_001022 [Glomeribacter sp. 1016415]|nr:hypothetical protein [Glomeribacter sp. 1016415]
MKLFRIINLVFWGIFISACGGGGNEEEKIDRQYLNKISPPYSERKIKENDAIHAINTTLGGNFITSQDYEHYMNLIAIKENPYVPKKQLRLMRKYYDGGKITDEFYTEERLATEWDQFPCINAIPYKDYIRQIGIFGYPKQMQNAIHTVNFLYNLALPYQFNTIENANLFNANRIMIDIKGYFLVLRQENNGEWWLLDNFSEGPKKISGSHIEWLNNLTQSFPGIKVLCFTSEDLLKAENSTKMLPASFKDSMTDSDPFGEDFIEEFFYFSFLSPSGRLTQIGEDLYLEKSAFKDNTYRFLYEFTSELLNKSTEQRIRVLEIFNSFIERSPESILNSGLRKSYREQINPATIDAFRKAARKQDILRFNQMDYYWIVD